MGDYIVQFPILKWHFDDLLAGIFPCISVGALATSGSCAVAPSLFIFYLI
jgi:hypothetical protein